MAQRSLYLWSLLLLSASQAAGEASCEQDECQGEAGDALLQLGAAMSTVKAVVEANCKPWCHKQSKSWDHLCSKSKCAACAECADPTPAPPPTPEPTPEPSPEPTEAADIEFRLSSGEPFKGTVAPGASGSTVQLGTALAGLSISPRSGALSWQPDISQAGDHWVVVSERDVNGKVTQTQTIKLTVAAGAALPSGLYVWPVGGSDANDGTAASPLLSVSRAVELAAPGQTVYVRGGRYESFQETVIASGTRESPVLVTRLDGERVCLTPSADRNAFFVPEESKGLVFRGFEIYGRAEKDEHFDILARTWWGVEDHRIGGKMGFDIDGQHVVVEECVIHDLAQKAVNVRIGRYVTVRNNVIYNIGHSSVSGGHGIMRQWDHSFGDGDDTSLFRFDFSGNLLFAVEQRIYSFIPKKKYCHMTIDEGKGILIDETTDKRMKARISNNLVLWGGVDNIRLKWTPNLQVENNAVMGEEGRMDPVPDGITATAKPSPMPNMSFVGNLAHTSDGSWSFDISKHLGPADHPGRLSNNFYSGGGSIRSEAGGVTGLAEGHSVFRDAAGLDFRAAASLPEGVGVDAATLARLMALAAAYEVEVAPSGWRHDHVASTEAILASRPTEHLGAPVEGKSKHEKGKKALFVPVVSEWYRKMCKCEKIELIPPEQWWESRGH
mmetsp:Transcript_69050/g.202147  ORF Transcript_69050/g.202147 Transcript_69050/m.202147 type:complete len:667 (-) Transcript_69050:49-2049(-)